MRGEWIEIGILKSDLIEEKRLSPCGESGLKLPEPGLVDGAVVSLPMRGEWIEIRARPAALARPLVSPHAGRVD